MPPEQLVHVVERAEDQLPATHCTQVLDADAATALDAVPAAHAAQLEAPVDAWYVPAAQLEQALAPGADRLPAAQLKQLDPPVAAW